MKRTTWIHTSLSAVLLTAAFGQGAAKAVNTEELAAAPQPASSQIAPFTDSTPKWAQDAISKWHNREIVKGDAEGRFAPERFVSRSEWAAMLNRTFQLVETTDVSFKDVATTAWYAKDVNLAASAGYMGGQPDGSFHPSAPITRQEAAVTLGKLLKLVTDADLPAYKDKEKIAAWAADSISAAAANGLLKGYEDQTFRPNAPITRAEAVVLLDRAAAVNGAWYGESGTYGPTSGVEKQSGNVIVNATGVTLRNTEISGDLIIGQGVGSGDVKLSNVKVSGTTYVYGGGEHSIHLENTVLGKVLVDKENGSVRLASTGTTTIEEAVVESGATLETVDDVKIRQVTLSKELPKGANIQLIGSFDSVQVEAAGVRLSIPAGKVKELTIGGQAADTYVATESGVTIESMVLNAAAKITGKGTIKEAIINAAGVSFDQAPSSVKLGDKAPKDITVNIGGKDTPAGNVTQPAAGGASGGSSGGAPVGGGGSGGSPGGGNPGGGNPGGGTPEPSPEPGEPDDPYHGPVYLERNVVNVTDTVYFSSKEAGTVFIFDIYKITNDSDFDLLLKDAENGIALKQQIDTNQRAYFTPKNFSIDKFPGTIAIVLFDSDQNYADVTYVSVLDETESLTNKPDTFLYRNTKDEPESIEYYFNRFIQLAPGKSVNDIVEIKLAVDKEFRKFTSDMGTIEIKDNNLYIHPFQKKLGKQFCFRLLAGSIITTDGQVNKQVDFGPVDSYNWITVLSSNWEVKMGEDVSFEVEEADTVYMVPESARWTTRDELEDMVSNHLANKVEVTEDQVGRPVKMSTQGLAENYYWIFTWNGGNAEEISLVP